MNFSKSQIEAIEFKDGACLVLAGPGSGKTAVLTARTSKLIHEYGVNPATVLVITFTKAAAMEMKQRFQALEGGKATAVTFGTFHAVFFNMLKIAYGYNSSQIITSDLKYNYLRQIISRLGLDSTSDDEGDFIESVLSEISLVKNNGTDIANFYSKIIGANDFRNLFKAYEDMLKNNHLIDFDDMLLMTYQLLKEREDHLKFWQNKYQYILIDEAQDMNRLQYEIVKLLSSPKDNVFMVGDDDQSIYAFRGAMPGLLKRFSTEYDNCKILNLTENYRCDENITIYANRLISKNTDRFSKDITAIHKGHGNVQIAEYESVIEENLGIIDSICKYHKAGIDYNNMAVFFRTNRQSTLLCEMLGQRNIPYVCKERIPVIFDHWICKDLLCYLRLGYGGRDRDDLAKIMNKPLRYLSRDLLSKRKIDFEEWKENYANQSWMIERIDSLEADLKIISRLSVFAAINYIRKGIGYEEYVRQYVREKGLDMEETIGILEEITLFSKDYITYDEFYGHILEFKEELAGKKEDAPDDAVSIMTLHSSKGLEFDVVFMPQMNEKLIPYKKAVLPAEIEEERRLCYVGMTRAKLYLNMSYNKKIHMKDSNKSIFIDEISNCN